MSAAGDAFDTRLDLAGLAERLGMAESVVSELIAHQYLPWPDPDGLFHPDEIDAAVSAAGGPQALVQASIAIATAPADPMAERMRAGLERLAAWRDEMALEAAQLREQLEDATRALQAADDEKAKLADKLAAKSGPQRDTLVEIALGDDVELFHHDDDVFATVPVNGHMETVKVRSRAFRRWLNSQFYARYKRNAGSEGLNDALLGIEGAAFDRGAAREVHVRLAGHDGRIYLDLGRDDWKVVEIFGNAPSSGPAYGAGHGWRVIEAADAPVRFVRPKGVRGLPVPESGGKLEWLKRYVNVHDADMPMVYAWLAAAFRPVGPYPVLALSSEQGGGKSTVTRVLRALIDPNIASIRSLPREERDLMIAAKNGWVIALDNVSNISPWLADALCRLATGGGFGARTLHTDDEETLFEAQRPQILNGIGELASRPDLADRALVVRLPSIPEDQREPESAFWRDFDDDYPLLLGAILDVVAGALKRLDSVQLELFPRMADFALWAQAAEPDLPVPAGSFMASYTENRSGLTHAAVDDSPFIAGVAAWARETGADWSGTAAELLGLMKVRMGEEHGDLPKSPRGVSVKLRRFAPALRAVGVSIDMDLREPGTGRRLIGVKAE